MKNISSHRGGFTLVEIMIVVAIIGLLASIAIPNYAQSRRAAHQAVCINNLQQIEGAIERWAMERISVDKDNRLTRAVVLIVKIDVAGVFLPDSNVWHSDSPLHICCAR